MHVHLADEAILVHGTTLLAVGQARCLCPHLLDVLENHVAMAVKGLNTRKQLAVVTDRDEHLRVRADGRLKDGEGSGGELVLLELRNLVLTTRKC